jgi:hypothetical protein
VVVFTVMNLIFADVSSTTTSSGTEDDLGIGFTGWLEVGRHAGGWHVGYFHFWSMLLEILVAVVLTWILSKLSARTKRVPAVNTLAFFVGAILLALAAIITHAVARSFLMDAMHREAANMTQAQKLHTAYTPDPQAVQWGRYYNILTIVGVALTALSLLSAVTALIRRERGWYLILILLWFFDFGLPMLL